jgi:hypothetical protein
MIADPQLLPTGRTMNNNLRNGRVHGGFKSATTAATDIHTATSSDKERTYSKFAADSSATKQSAAAADPDARSPAPFGFQGRSIMSDPFIGPPDCIIEGSVTASNQGSEIISKGPARFQASSYKLTIRELGKATQEKFSGMVPISRRKEVVAFICDREERNECIEGPHRSRCRLLHIHQRAAATIM